MAALLAGPHRPAEQAELFYEPLLARYLDAPGTIARDWLHEEVEKRLALADCRFVLLTGEPGAGKTGFMAALARSRPDALRYFIRLDSTTPLSGADTVSLLLRTGHQLAHLHPEIFDPELLKIEVNQRVEQAAPGARVTGVKIGDLNASPFYRTAIRVQQDVTGLAGGLTGIEIARATTDPRLLEPGTLSQMALFDPARVLARQSPGAMIVVLVDALDETIGVPGGGTVLDWLEACEAPPANVRFVLSSRPHPRLRALESVRGASFQIVPIDAESDPVAADVRRFATNLFDSTKALEKAPGVTREDAVTSLVRAAQGNFAYLTAYGRSFRAAMEAGSAEQVAELLEFESLPAGLPQLYAAFARRMRRQIEALGHLDVASPRGPDDEFVPAWEGVGQRLMGVLSVAFAPLTLKQLAALGGVRVWESAAGNVLRTLTPFLDEVGGGWRLFHSSLGEFLRSADQQGADDVAIDAREWHTRVVRYYRGAKGWAEVDWRKVDSYGLLHAAAHVAAASDDPLAVCKLVTSGLRAASKERFLGDLPFRRVVETARASVKAAGKVDAVLAEGVFLRLVLLGLHAGAGKVDPAVLGLMARMGRVEEALVRAEVMAPGLQKYRSLEAIRACTPAGSRAALGALDGVELLVGAALEVPATAGPLVGMLGYDRGTCLQDAAVALVEYDLDRALGLAELADKYDRVARAGDAVLGAAAERAAPEKALELLGHMQTHRPEPAVEAAERAGAGPARNDLIAFAVAHLEDEEPRMRMPLVARLIALGGGADTEGAGRLRTMLEELAAGAATSSDGWGVVRAAEILHGTDAALAERILKACDREEVDSLMADTLTDAARAWASWGKPEEARQRLDRALAAYRALGWYGPARDIAEAAGVAAAFDAGWSERLADEAMALVEPEAGRGDTFEAGRLDGILAGMVGHFLERDRMRALRAARWISGSWIHGSPWDSTGGRGGALAMIGLRAADAEPALAAELLAKCLAEDDGELRLGRSDARAHPSGLFRLKADAAAGPPGLMRMTNQITYLTNAVNYWAGGRKWRFFSSPAAVLRSIDAHVPATASWARAVGEAVDRAASSDVEGAIAMAYWPADPAERLVGLGALTRVLAEDDLRRHAVGAAIAAALQEMPEYEAEVDLGKVQQGPILRYLDPTARARFEAAVAMGRDLYNLLPQEREEFWYLGRVHHAENLFQDLLAGRYSGLAPEEFEQQMDEVSGSYTRFDPLLADLLELAACYSLASIDPSRAHARVGRIANPALQAEAWLLCLGSGELRGAGLSAEALKLLKALPEDVSGLQRAELAATAIRVCEAAGEEAGAILEWASEGLADADPLLAAHGLAALSATTPQERRAALLGQALEVSEGIGNQYLRADAVADLLGPAVAAGDAGLTAGILDRLLDGGWISLMEGMRRAMPEIVAAGGADLVGRMDGAMRRAQTVLVAGRQAGGAEHFDGVLPAAQREQALKVAMVDAARGIEAYLATYLDQDDIGPLHEWVQDSRLHAPDPGDLDFPRLHGRRSGFSVWLAAQDQPVWRVVDIRFEFASAEDAAAYHARRIGPNSEGKPEVAGAPTVGEECRVFGGTETLKFAGATAKMTAYYYLFRVGRVVVKLFAAQGQESRKKLTPRHLVPLAQRIRERIVAAGLGKRDHDVA
jgi:hypothetical protein